MNNSHSGLNFRVVGASVSGLASAIALKRAGHSVLVLEKDLQLGGIGSVSNGLGCARLPPSGSKTLFDLGLESELKANSASIWGFSAYKRDIPDELHLDVPESLPSPDLLGTDFYDPEILSEARGEYMQLAHRELVRILHDLALKSSEHPEQTDAESSPKVSVLFGAEVVNVDCEACSVPLRSGQTYTGNAIIGADGLNGVVRRALIKEQDPSETDTVTGITVFNAVVPHDIALEHELGLFCDYPGVGLVSPLPQSGRSKDTSRAGISSLSALYG